MDEEFEDGNLKWKSTKEVSKRQPGTTEQGHLRLSTKSLDPGVSLE